MTMADGGRDPVSAFAESVELVKMRTAGLAEMDLFEDCSANQLEAVAQRMRPLRAAAGPEAGEEVGGLLQHRLGAAVVGREVEPAELDRAGDEGLEAGVQLGSG